MPEPHWSGKNQPIDSGSSGDSGTLSGLSDVTGQPDAGTGPVYDSSGNAPLVPVVTQQDLDAILASVAAVDWHTIGQPGEPPFHPGWGNLAGPDSWAPCRYRLTLNNVVHIEGVAAHDTPLSLEDAPAPIFTLTADCLPGGQLAYIAESGIDQSGGGPTISRVIVQPDGTVAWGGYITVGQGAESFLSLCGINYSVQADHVTR